MMRRLLGTTALAAAFTLAAAPAQAQQLPYGSVVVFGDSLSDTNNLAALGAAPTAPYVNGRFTSAGGVWVDYFDDITGITGVTSRAFGGARATRTTVTDLTAQVTAYLGATPAIPSDRLVSIWIGGNDYLNGPSTATIPLVATAVATQAGRLRAAGASNFLLFNLPGLGDLPANATASAADRANANLLSQLHAAAFRDVAAGLRNTGATVVIADIFTLFNDVRARPGVYGFTNLNTPCFAPTSAAPGAPLVATGACATAAGLAGSLAFDLIHPTSAAHRLIAQFANGSLVTSLGTPQALATGTQLTFNMFDNATDLVTMRSAGARAGGGSVAVNEASVGKDARWGVFTYGSFNTGDSKDVAGQADYDKDAMTIGIGADYQIDSHVTAGLAIGYGDGKFKLGNDLGRLDTKTYSGTAYGTFAAGNLWGDLFVGYSYDDLTINRTTGFAPVPNGVGDTFAHTYGMGAAAGYAMFSEGGFSAGPVIGTRYANTAIKGYAETLAGPLGLTVDEMKAESWTGRIGVQFAGRAGDKDLAIVPTAELAYEREMSNADRTVRGVLPGGELATTGVGAGERGSITADLGLGIESSSGITVGAAYRGTVSGGNGNDHALTARVRFNF